MSLLRFGREAPFDGRRRCLLLRATVILFTGASAAAWISTALHMVEITPAFQQYRAERAVCRGGLVQRDRGVKMMDDVILHAR